MRRAAHGVFCVQVLSTPVMTLDLELSAAAALAQLDAANLPSAHVVDDNGVLVGVVTASALADLRDDDEAEVEDALTPVRAVAMDDATLAEVIQGMADQGADRLPVITGHGRLVGIITALDVVRWLTDRP